MLKSVCTTALQSRAQPLPRLGITGIGHPTPRARAGRGAGRAGSSGEGAQRPAPPRRPGGRSSRAPAPPAPLPPCAPGTKRTRTPAGSKLMLSFLILPSPPTVSQTPANPKSHSGGEARHQASGDTEPTAPRPGLGESPPQARPRTPRPAARPLGWDRARGPRRRRAVTYGATQDRRPAPTRSRGPRPPRPDPGPPDTRPAAALTRCPAGAWRRPRR